MGAMYVLVCMYQHIKDRTYALNTTGVDKARVYTFISLTAIAILHGLPLWVITLHNLRHWALSSKVSAESISSQFPKRQSPNTLITPNNFQYLH